MEKNRTMNSLQRNHSGKIRHSRHSIELLMHLLYLMRVKEKVIQRRVALALAHLCPHEEQRRIFIDNKGMDILLELVGSTNLKQQDGLLALYKMANKTKMLSSVDAAPSSSVDRN